MTEEDAIDLIRPAVAHAGGSWADLGAGSGTFTRALAVLIGPSGHVQAVETDAAARRELVRQSAKGESGLRAPIAVVDGDFTGPLALSALDGIPMANALHFVPDHQQAATLRQIAAYLGTAGRLVVVEYDRDRGNQWVPYPVSLKNFGALCKSAGLAEPTVVGRMASAFGGSMYAAWTSAV